MRTKLWIKYYLSCAHMIKTGFYIPDYENYTIKQLLKELI